MKMLNQEQICSVIIASTVKLSRAFQKNKLNKPR
jgi:hypothetical protein